MSIDNFWHLYFQIPSLHHFFGFLFLRFPGCCQIITYFDILFGTNLILFCLLRGVLKFLLVFHFIISYSMSWSSHGIDFYDFDSLCYLFTRILYWNRSATCADRYFFVYLNEVGLLNPSVHFCLFADDTFIVDPHVIN